jgi:acetylornithine deacetylase/succinyl-diaminopimelate desuccinylase-like protein
MEITRPPHQPSPLTTELFRTFEEVLSEQHPDAVVLPVMLTGATDSAQLRAAGIPAYGFGPGIVLGDDNGIHGNNEFLRVEPYFEYVNLMWQIVERITAAD